MKQATFQALVVISTRKAKFLERVGPRLLATAPSTVDREEAEGRLRQAVAALDNLLFVSDREKSTKVIDPSTPLEDLHLDAAAILDQLRRGIRTSPSAAG